MEKASYVIEREAIQSMLEQTKERGLEYEAVYWAMQAIMGGCGVEKACLSALKVITRSSDAEACFTAPAGFNAELIFFAKPVKVSAIVIDPEISKVFSIQDKTPDKVRQKADTFGYVKNQPVVLIKGENILVDGHRYLAAAKESGLDEVPAVEMAFENRDEALLYALERQVVHRNLTGPEILKAARMIPGKTRYGKGQAERMAKRLEISRATVYQARAIIQKGPEAIVQAVENGDMSIKKGYITIKKPKAEQAEYTVPFAWVHHARPPDSAKFLKVIVRLLVEAEQKKAARLLIKHFLKTTEREGFFALLPESVRKTLVDAAGRLVW